MNIEEKLKYNIRFLLKAQLAVESYEDDNGVEVPLIHEAYKNHEDFRKVRSSLSDEEQIIITDSIAKKYNEAFDLVGRDKFIFYDDGDINYIWNKERRKNE